MARTGGRSPFKLDNGNYDLGQWRHGQHGQHQRAERHQRAGRPHRPGHGPLPSETFALERFAYSYAVQFISHAKVPPPSDGATGGKGVGTEAAHSNGAPR